MIVSTIYETLENNKPKDLANDTPLRNLGHLLYNQLEILTLYNNWMVGWMDGRMDGLSDISK